MNLEELGEHLCRENPDLCPLFSVEFGDGVLSVDRAKLHEAAEELRELGFDRLGWMTAVDWKDHFETVYRLQSRSMRAGIFLKCEVPRDEPTVASLTDLWASADWQEREAYDMFGIRFEGHPDLRRILLPDDWEGYPLRKDYEDEHVIKRPDYI